MKLLILLAVFYPHTYAPCNCAQLREGPDVGISNEVVYGAKEIPGIMVTIPGSYAGVVSLDTNVFKFDTNRGVVTLKDRWQFEPLNDSAIDLGPASYRHRYVRVWWLFPCLAIGIVMGWIIGQRRE